MINWLIPMAGKSVFFDSPDYYFPKPLVDVASDMMIEHVINSIAKCKKSKKLLFVINAADNRKFHLGQILTLLAKGQCVVAEQVGDAMGALCSCLLMIDEINNDTPLIISNSDQVIDVDYDAVLDYFEANDADGGAIVFQSAHPQWSYVALDDAGRVVETAEKRPISTNAIAGFYYFKSGRSFVEAAQTAIDHGATINDRFFISSSFNEMILKNFRIIPYRIEASAYHSFYSPAMIDRYLKTLGPPPREP
jgi:NDP-sugar pyrophosphorylase family protein